MELILVQINSGKERNNMYLRTSTLCKSKGKCYGCTIEFVWFRKVLQSHLLDKGFAHWNWWMNYIIYCVCGFARVFLFFNARCPETLCQCIKKLWSSLKHMAFANDFPVPVIGPIAPETNLWNSMMFKTSNNIPQ